MQARPKEPETQTLPVTIISGYLGAGKTTLLNRLLQAEDGRRVAVLVNDFGEVNIDAALIRNHDGRTIGLANGCVCCSIADDLGGALDSIAAISPAVEWVYLEASGVADPTRVSAYAQTWPGYSLAGVWVLADVTRIRQQAADKYIGTTVVRQLRGAQVIALSHIDLLAYDSTLTHDITQWLQTFAPHARIVSLDVNLPLNTLLSEVVHYDAERPLDHLTSLLPEPDHHVTAITFTQHEPIDRLRLTHLLDTLDSEVVRAKGFVYCTDAPQTALLLQYAGNSWTLAPTSPGTTAPPETTLIFHVTGDNELTARLRTSLADLSSGSP